MSETSWKIYWNEYTSDTYLYGSEVSFRKKDSVLFKNELMPPGTVINRWYSRTNYQMNRIEPSLPLIDGEGSYRIQLHISGTDISFCLLRVVFYDRNGVEADNVIIRDGQGEFRGPLRTYSYEIQLISAGVKSFEFHYMLLTELSDEK